MGSHYNKGRNKEDENNELLIFGYSSKLYKPDEKSVFINEERHLQSWNGDGSLRIDRYDCRLLLTSIDDRIPDRTDEECPTEMMEEDMCEEERYRDMYLDIQTQAQKEADIQRQKAEIPFNYNSSGKPTETPIDDGSDSENEAFVPPTGIKLPLGLATPENLKQSHIIERTAIFVVEKGPQMEIVIKAKQRNNPEQFGFLDFDNVLYPYYKYISKMIREKKYTPTFKSKEEKSITAEEPAEKERKCSNALTAIASQHSDSDNDSDSDYELHPSLFAAQKRESSPDILDRTKNASGPRQKPESIQPAEPKVQFNITKSNDMYASLFKSLTGYTEPKEEPKIVPVVEEKRPSSVPVREELIENDSNVDIEWQQWFYGFYGRYPSAKAPHPMIPPPPDLEPIVAKYAEFVARHGSHAEFGLVARPDLKLHFMDPNSPFFSYYQHKVRYAQWEMHQELPTTSVDTEESSHSPAMMNRKQRRRLQDAQKLGPAPPPGVIDPFLHKATIQTDMEMHKTQSCPADLGKEETIQDLKPYKPTGAPVSFSLSKEDTKVSSYQSTLSSVEEIPSCSGLADKCAKPLITNPPEPPAISNNQQLDRKEKARIFMEKLLIEKKNQKMKEAEEAAKIQELEKQKADIEEKLSGEDLEKVKEKDREKKVVENPVKTLDMIDQIINSRIDNILQASGMASVNGAEKDPQRRSTPKERKRSKERKSKKHKRKRSRTRSRSPDSRDRRRKRSRSRSSERNYRRHRY